MPKFIQVVLLGANWLNQLLSKMNYGGKKKLKLFNGKKMYVVRAPFSLSLSKTLVMFKSGLNAKLENMNA